MPEEPLAVSISSSTSLNPDEIARRSFPTARKGIDADAVRRYLESIADDVRSLLEREAQLRRRVADAERKASEPRARRGHAHTGSRCRDGPRAPERQRRSS